MVCLNHPDREAVYKCAACGKPICEECAWEQQGDVYCSENCAEKGIASKNRSAYIMDTTVKMKKKSRKKGLIIFIILVIIAAAGTYFYMQNKDAVNKKINTHLEVINDTVEAAKNSAVNTGDSAVPKDSKYRRQRNEIIGK